MQVNNKDFDGYVDPDQNYEGSNHEGESGSDKDVGGDQPVDNNNSGEESVEESKEESEDDESEKAGIIRSVRCSSSALDKEFFTVNAHELGLVRTKMKLRPFLFVVVRVRKSNKWTGQRLFAFSFPSDFSRGGLFKARAKPINEAISFNCFRLDYN